MDSTTSVLHVLGAFVHLHWFGGSWLFSLLTPPIDIGMRGASGFAPYE